MALFGNIRSRTAPDARNLNIPQPRTSQGEMDARYGDVPLPAVSSVDEAARSIMEYGGVPPQAFGLPPVPAQAVGTPLDPDPLARRDREIPNPATNDLSLLDQEQMQNQSVPVNPEDYSRQFLDEQAKEKDFQQGFEAMQSVVDPTTGQRMPGDFTKAAELILGEGNEKAKYLSPGEAEKYAATETQIKNAADRVSSPLALISERARQNLLSSSSMVYDSSNPDSRQAKGYTLMLAEGFEDSEMETVADMAGIASYSALSQIPRAKADAEEDVAVDPNTGVINYDNVIASGTHFMKNMAKTVGLPEPSPGFFEGIMATHFQAEVQKGSYALNRSADGKIEYLPTDAQKIIARKVGTVARIATARLGRNVSSRTPQIVGSALGEKQTFTKRSLTSNSVLGRDLDTSAAETVKDMMGSVSYRFLPSHVALQEKFMTAMLSPEFLINSPDEGVYSTHYMAEHYGLSQKDFNKIKNNQLPPRDEAKRVGWSPIPAAVKIMNNIIKQKGMVLEAIKGAEGLRFAEIMHSIMNHRYFINSYDLDYMGSKDMIRDILNFGERDIVYGKSLFPNDLNSSLENDRLKSEGLKIFKIEDGVARGKALESLTPDKLGALGTMIDAVLNYHTVVKPLPDVLKMPDRDLIGLYTPELANALADLGGQYNAYINDPEGDANNKHNNILTYLAAIPKGEFLANAALWDDMFQLKNDAANPKSNKLGRSITHTTISDGTQSGLFIQAFQHGNSEHADRLGRAKYADEERAPRDLRDATMASMIEEVDRINRKSGTIEDSNTADAFSAFFAELPDVYRGDYHAMANEFFKAPLMQVSYSKDAGMFQGFLEDTLSRTNIEPLVSKYLLPHFGSLSDAAASLNISLENVLREAISTSVRKLQDIGYGMAILDKPLVYKSITGDDVLISPAGLTTIPKTVDYNSFTTGKHGFKFLARGVETIDFMVDDGSGMLTSKSIPRKMMGLLPGHAKPVQYYWDNQAKVYRPYKSFAGSSLSREAAVMPTQAIDAAWITLTMLEVNKGRSKPRPVSWVHDSIISTGGQGLIYRNAYNNITIPRSIKTVAKTNGDIYNAYKEAKAQELRLIKIKGVVGIGSDGQYESMGGFFDSMFYQFEPMSEYKAIFLKRRNSSGAMRTELDWNKKVLQVNKILDEAINNGYVPPNLVPESERKSMAVNATEYEALLGLFETVRGISPRVLQAWADNSEAKGIEAGKFLIKRAKYGGIIQMAPSGGARPMLSSMITESLASAKKPVTPFKFAAPVAAEVVEEAPVKANSRAGLLEQAQRDTKFTDEATEVDEVPAVTSGDDIPTNDSILTDKTKPISLVDLVNYIKSKSLIPTAANTSSYLLDLRLKGYDVSSITYDDVDNFFSNIPI